MRAEAAESWLAAKTMIALSADERVKGRQISVETVKGTVVLRGKVDSDEAKTAAAQQRFSSRVARTSWPEEQGPNGRGRR